MAGFFFSGLWALYRKMYGWFFLLLGATSISTFLEKSGESELSAMTLIIPWVAFAIFANSIYQKNLTKKIAEAKMTIDDENKLLEYLQYKGGVHTWVIWVFAGLPFLGILAAILIPMYKDSTLSKNEEITENWQMLDHYMVNEGLAKDLSTGLIWMRCSIGKN